MPDINEQIEGNNDLEKVEFENNLTQEINNEYAKIVEDLIVKRNH